MKKVEEDRLIHAFLAKFEVVPVNRRFGTIFRRNVMPGTAGGRDIQDAVEQAAGVTPGSADVRLCWWEVVPDDRPETIVNFPEDHNLKFYLKGLIILGRPRCYMRRRLMIVYIKQDP